MYGLIGYPLGHSFSAKYFTEKFAKENIDDTYCLFPLTDICQIEEIVLSTNGLRGLNVTIPYKQDVIQYLNYISDDAAAIGAVNVIKILNGENDTKPVLEGYNTDWQGFYLSLLPLLKEDVHSALVLGTGGASKAVCFALEKLGITSVKVSRRAGNDLLTYGQIDKATMKENLLIVNTTPVGMYPETDCCPEIPYNLLTPSHICYDLVYNPFETVFINKSRAMGAVTKNGLEMLHLQADLSWKIWNAL